MPVTRCMLSAFAAATFALVAVAGCSSGPSAPPTDIDVTVPIASLDGWTALETSIGEPPGSTRLEDYIAFWRESLDAARRDPDPVARQEAEDAWWEEARRALTSMVGAANAEMVLEWMERTFRRRTGGAS